VINQAVPDPNVPDATQLVFHVNLAGQAPAYNIIINAFRPDTPGQMYARPVIIPYMHAPDSQQGHILWRDPDLAAWIDATKARLINIEVFFTNIFGQPTRFRHSCRLSRRGATHLTDAPTYFDLAGRKVKLGE